MNSYLTRDELNQVLTNDYLDGQEAPPRYCYVSKTQFSIARHYGGTRINGHHYTYIPETDELIRDDVLKTVAKTRKDAQKEKAKQASEKQIGLL